MDFLEKSNIPVDDWALYSPNLNSIKHVWVEHKCRLHRKFPDIGNIKEGLDHVKGRLAEVLPKIWEEIPEAYFENLWKSMPDWVASVIDSKGWYTRYWEYNSIRVLFSSHRRHYMYLDNFYFWLEDCIIFGWGVILIIVAGGCVHEGLPGPDHQDFSAVTVQCQEYTLHYKRTWKNVMSRWKCLWQGWKNVEVLTSSWKESTYSWELPPVYVKISMTTYHSTVTNLMISVCILLYISRYLYIYILIYLHSITYDWLQRVHEYKQ